MIYEAIDTWNSSYIEHHGVKGMKWGVRRDPDNPNYTSDQRRRDKAVYGRRGVKRINRLMNRGNSISTARSREASRINSFRNLASTAGTIGSVIGGVGGAIGGFTLSNIAVNKYGTGDPSTDMLIKSTVAAGSFSAGQVLGRKGSQSIAMILGGYSPSKFRY